jgi:hypothetical protein
MNTKLLTLLIVAVLGFNGLVKAQQDGFGLGMILGDPTGISIKYYMNDENAVDGAVSWNLNGGWFNVHADYLRHWYVFDLSEGELPVYAGVGGRIGFGDQVRVGIRIPLGITYKFDNAPFDIFLEIVPEMDLVPATVFNMQGGIGFRYFFN